MEKNLPFTSFNLADKGYNNFVLPFLGKLDDGNVFKNIVTILLRIASYGLLLGGVVLSFVEIFGDHGFVKQFIAGDYLTGFQKFGSVIGLIVGFLLSVLVSWLLYSILKKRTNQVEEINYEGLLDFVFIKAIPKFILIVGEILFVLAIYAGLLQIIAALVGSYVYAPLSSYPEIFLSIFPGLEIFSGVIPNQIYANYNDFAEFIKIGFIGVLSGFILLIVFYIYKEIYCYILKLVVNLIKFLPKFAIPIALRRKNEN